MTMALGNQALNRAKEKEIDTGKKFSSILSSSTSNLSSEPTLASIKVK